MLQTFSKVQLSFSIIIEAQITPVSSILSVPYRPPGPFLASLPPLSVYALLVFAFLQHLVHICTVKESLHPLSTAIKGRERVGWTKGTDSHEERRLPNDAEIKSRRI